MILGYIIMIFPIIAILSLLVYIPFLINDKLHQRKRPVIRHVALYAFIGCCLSLLYLTILWYYPNISFHPEYRFLNLKPFIWISETYAMGAGKMMQQLVLNIAMFIPYGLLLPIIFKRTRKIFVHILVVLLTTCSIETLQYMIGRSADIDDVIMNFLGGLLGLLFFMLIDHVFQGKIWWDNVTGKGKFK